MNKRDYYECMNEKKKKSINIYFIIILLNMNKRMN